MDVQKVGGEKGTHMMQNDLAEAGRQARLVALRPPNDDSQVGLEGGGERDELVDVDEEVIGLEERDDGG